MGAFYKLLSTVSEKTAKELHNIKSPKPFTFSMLIGAPSRVEKNGLIYEKGDRVKIFFSSWDDEILDVFGLALFKCGNFIVGKAVFEIEKYVSYQRDDVISKETKFVLKSPMTLSLPKKVNGKLFHEFLSPTDQEFGEAFKKNLKKRYRMFVGDEPGEVEIFPDEDYITKRRTSKLIDIKGIKIRGHIFPFVLKGDPKLIKFGYYAGFGERTGQGFGCAEVYSKDS